MLEQKVEGQEIDTSSPTASRPETLRDYKTNADLKGLLFINPSTSDYYITMNMAVPPFDDIHVRKAVSFAIDKAGVRPDQRRRRGDGADRGSLR